MKRANNDVIIEIATTGGPVELARIKCEPYYAQSGEIFYDLSINNQLIFTAIFENEGGRPGQLIKIKTSQKIDPRDMLRYAHKLLQP